MEHSNTKAKYLLQDIDFSHDDAHLAYTLGSGAASKMNDAYVLKSDDTVITEEAQAELADIIKAETDIVMELSFQEFLERFLHMYGDNSRMLCELMGYSYEDETYPMSELEARKMVDEKLSRIHLMKSEDMSLNQAKQLKDTLTDFRKATEGELPNSAFAYVPDKDKTSTRKLRIDDANHTRAAVAALGEGFRGNKVDIPSEDLASVKRKVKQAYEKFFPENDVPEVLKSLDSDSDPVLESNVETANTGINKEETPVTDKVELSKSEHEDLLKMQEELAIFKAEKAEALKKSKEDIVKSALFIDNQEAVVEAIIKSEHGELIESIITKALAAIGESSKEEVETLTKSLEDKDAELATVKEELEDVKKKFAAPVGIEGDNNKVDVDETKDKLKTFIKSKYHNKD